MSKKQSTRPRSIRRRLTRLTFGVLMVVFIIIGIVVFYAVRNQGRASVSQTHGVELVQFSAAVEARISAISNEVRTLANSVDTRQFAGQTITVGGSGLNEAQQRMLGDFVALIQSDPNSVVEVRYVTRSGSVWTRVSNINGITPDGNVYLNKLARDISLSDTLRKQPGQVSMDVLSFATDIDGQRLTPLKPIFRFSAPVAAPGDNANVPGIIQIDIAASPILSLITLPPASSRLAVPDRKLMLINQNGQIMVDTSAPNDTYPARGLAGPQSSFAKYAAIDRTMGTQYADFRALQVGSNIFSGNRITEGGASDMPWWLLLIDNTSSVLAQGDQLAAFSLIGVLALGLVISLGVSAIVSRALRPLAAAQLLLQRMTQAGRADSAPVAAAANDEIGQLVNAFERMSGEVRDLNRDRERQVGRFNRGVEMASRIGREAAAAGDVNRVVKRAADLIVDEYGYLYAQVFLVDDVRAYAVLVYAHGAPDTEILTDDYRAEIGADSLIGRVVAAGRAMTINEVIASAATHHPVQPETRSELAVPLTFAGRTLGALDVQSRATGAFGDEELRLFQLLADALAAAVHNARMAGESLQRSESAEVLNRQMTRAAWEQTERDYELEPSYRYDLMQVERGSVEQQPTDLSAPLAIRGQVIGTLAAAAPEGQEFTQADQQILHAVAERVSLAIENARLFAETQSSLAQTSVLYQLSRYLNEADTLDDIVEAVVVAVMTDATRGQIAVFSETTGSSPQEWLEIRADWASAGNKRLSGALAGRHLHVQDIPLLLQMTPSEVTLVPDLSTDTRIDAELRSLFASMEAGALVLIPFSVRGQWRGIILVEFPKPRQFTPAEARIYSALIDQIGVAVDNRQLFTEAQEQARRALALAEVGQLASRIGSRFEDSIAEVFTRVARAAQYDRWLLMLLDPSERWLQTATSNISEEVIDGASLELATAQHPLAEAARANSTLIVNEPSIYPAFISRGERFWRQMGKHIVAPVRIADVVVGALLIGRPLNAVDLSESDEQLVNTLAAQVAVAVENRRLFQTAQDERQTLRTTLEALPAGVLVLDGQSYRPVQYNEEAVRLLRHAIDSTAPFDPTIYRLVRSGSHQPYPANELPIYASGSAQIDDVAVLHDDGRETALLMDAAPLFDARGVLSAVVVAFTDISVLRVLENTLQDNLRDTVALYEATRSLTEAAAESDVFDVIMGRMTALRPSGAYVLVVDAARDISVARALDGGDSFPLPQEALNTWRMVSIPDMREQNEFGEVTSAQLIASGVAAFVSVPLRARASGDEPIGWVVLTFAQPRALTAQEERFVTTLSDSAAVALENRSLFRSTETALAETASLYRATTSISRARDLGELIHTVADSLGTLLPDVSGVYLFDQPGQHEGPRELFNTSSDGLPAPFASIIAGQEDAFDQPFVLSDIDRLDSSDPLVAAFAGSGLTMVAAATLRAKGVAQGCVLVGFRRPSQFGENEVRYLGAIADSTSVVLDNIFLFDQIQATLDETSLMYQSSRALGDSATPDDVVKVVTEVIEPMAAVIFLAMLDGGDWHAPSAFARVVSSNHQQPFGLLGPLDTLLTAEQFPAWRQLSSGNILMMKDIDDDRQLTQIERLGLASLGLRAVAIIPLDASRRALGALVIGWAETHEFSERDLRIYQSFAEQASLKLDAARLLAQTERRARQLATSAEVSRYASTILDLNELLPRIVDLLRDSFSYDHAQIFLMDANDSYAVLRASTGDAGRQLLAINHRLQKSSPSIIGQVTATGFPVVALDTAAADSVHKPNPYLPNTRSEMAVPLVLKGEVVGALDVQSNQANAFDNDDVAVLTTLAGQIAVAIDNANLFEEASRRATEMSFLFGVTTAAASAQTLTDALQNVSGELQRSLDALSVTLYLPQLYVDLHDNETLMLRPVAMAGSNQPLSELSEISLAEDTPSLISRVSASRQPYLIGSIDQEAGYVPVAAEARSAVIVPLTYGTELVGLINMESAALNAYDDDTLRLLLTLSGTLSAIVQNQQLLEQVQQTNEQLRELDRLKSDFLANMSHELRTPLNSIIGFSRVILKGIDGPLTEMQEQDLSTIYTSGQHLLNLINDILDQAKLAAGKMDLQSDYFEMKSVIDGVRSIGIGLVKDKAIDIRIEADSGLPQAYGDELRTRQVLLNLVSNASKFTREGSITLRAYPTAQDGTGVPMIRVDVIDTGIGIAEKDIPLLFEAFRQVDSSLTRTVGGTGLGLPIAKSLIEMQGGEMLVQSKVNVGSTFSIMLPTAPLTAQEQADDAPDEAASVQASNDLGTDVKLGSGLYDTRLPFRAPIGPARSKSSGPLDTQSIPPMLIKRQILIVDDNPEMVDQFRRVLQREGYDIYAASIPLEAEAMASGLHPTLLILDVNFSNGAGWSILQMLKGRDDTRDIPVIVVTLSDEEQRAKDCGAFRFIRRPFVPEVLTDAVAAAEHESRIDRILIIDDQPEHARLLEDLLQSEGEYNVFSAGSGQEGVALVARRRPNLVILDLRMPEMDGFTVAEELRANPETANIPILVVTGETLVPEERERLRNLEVLLKTDISLEQSDQFMTGVKTHLTRTNGA